MKSACHVSSSSGHDRYSFLERSATYIVGNTLTERRRLPFACVSLNRGLCRWHIPYVFATNHGGTPESEKAEILSTQFSLPIKTEQMLLSHTPMRQLVSQYEDKLILVVGQTKKLTDTIMHLYVIPEGHIHP